MLRVSIPLSVAVFLVIVLTLVVSAAEDPSAPPAGNRLYAMGSSNVNRIDEWLNAFLEMNNVKGTCARISLAGAPMHWIWQVRQERNPNPETYLQTNHFDILYMVASTVWIQRQQEVPPCVAFAKAALEGNPNARIHIQERKYIEPYADGLRYCYFWPENKDPELTMEFLFRPHYLKTIHDMASQLKRKVYLTPAGSCIEAVKRLAGAGKLDGYKDRLCVYQSRENQHLSPFGHYVHAAAVWASVYRRDPRQLPSAVYQYGGAKLLVELTEHDADLVNQTVYSIVRNTPFSGWYVKEPSTYEEYMAALWEEVRNFETFDNVEASQDGEGPHDGSYVGTNGLKWTYDGGWGTKRSDLAISGSTLMLGSSRDGISPVLSATFPNGVSWLTFQYRGRYNLPGPADTYKYRLEVVAGGKTIAVLDKIVEKAKKHRVGAQEYACLLEGIEVLPGGELKFVSTGTDAVRIDNIRWKDYSAGAREKVPSVGMSD
jgi:hypothetical protein